MLLVPSDYTGRRIVDCKSANKNYELVHHANQD